MADYRGRLANDLTASIFHAMEVADGLDSTAARKYGEAAAADAVEWAVRLVLSYEPLVGPIVFDLGRALNDGVFYAEIEE